jgi:hypothetical protein
MGHDAKGGGWGFKSKAKVKAIGAKGFHAS